MPLSGSLCKISRGPTPISAFAGLPFIRDDYDSDSDDEDEDDQDKDSEGEDEEDGGNKQEKKKEKTKCDGGKTCICNKPASEYPEHEWTLTFAGHRKFMSQFDMYDVRACITLTCTLSMTTWPTEPSRSSRT